MNIQSDTEWERLTYNEKNGVLFERQKTLLATFLEHGAISQEQYDKSLRDMSEKMGYSSTNTQDE